MDCGDAAGWSLYMSSDIIGYGDTQQYILGRAPSANGGYWLVAAYINDIGHIPRSIVDIIQTRPDSGQPMRVAEQLIRKPAPIQFATGSDRVETKDPDALMQLARFLEENPEHVMEIVGHADNTGAPELNADLSERRARNVSKLLMADYGVKPSQLETMAKGEDSPVARNETDEGMRLNRRVELRIKPASSER